VTADSLRLPTRSLDPALVMLLKGLAPGDRLKVTHTVKVGNKSWTHDALGVFRGVNALATGVTTDRVPEDDIVVPTLHFTKDNGELTSIALDEHTRVVRA
jgi:hypothetical protein